MVDIDQTGSTVQPVLILRSLFYNTHGGVVSTYPYYLILEKNVLMDATTINEVLRVPNPSNAAFNIKIRQSDLN